MPVQNGRSRRAYLSWTDDSPIINQCASTAVRRIPGVLEEGGGINSSGKTRRRELVYIYIYEYRELRTQGGL